MVLIFFWWNSLWHRFFNESQEQNHRNNMSVTEIRGDWNVIKGKMKQHYAQLTDDDLIYVEGA